MSSVYSTPFIYVTGLDGATTYTVPDGYTAIVRDCDVFMGSQVLGAVLQLLGAAGQCFFYVSSDPLTPVWVPWRGRHVLSAGDTFTASVTTGNADVSVSGYLLSLP